MRNIRPAWLYRVPQNFRPEALKARSLSNMRHPGTNLLRCGDVLQHLNDFLRCLRPGYSRRVHLLKGVNDVVVVERNVGRAHGGAVAGIKGGVPLLVFVTEHSWCGIVIKSVTT
jgi:hypothetical protein